MPGQTPTTDLPELVLEEEVLATVRDILVDVIGEDYVTELDIGMATAFRADLDIESIEFVALGESLRALYGDRIDFVEWLTTMELEEIIALTVGELVDHIVQGLRRPLPNGDGP